MNEEKKDLSLTREMKYKELQELLNKEENEIKENSSLKEKEKKEHLQKIKQVEDEEDIYLTQSLRPMKASKKIKKGLINFGLFLSIFSLLGLITFFFVYPFLTKYFFITPKEVFTKSIDQIHSSLKIEEEALQNYFSIDSKMTLDTNVESLRSLTSYSYDSSFIYDFENQNHFTTIKVNDEEDTYGIDLFTEEGRLFLHQEGSDASYYFNEISTEIFPLKEIKNILKNPNNYNHFLDKEAQYIKASMDEKNMSKDKDELYAFNEKKKVTRFTYRLHENEWRVFLENHNQFLLQDEECLEDLSILLGKSVDEIKDMLSKRETSFKEIAFHLYFEKGNQFVGFDIEIDGFRRVYYYQYANQFVFYVNFNTEESTEELNCTPMNQHIIEINGVLDATKKINVQYNGKVVASFALLPEEENQFAFDYTLYGEEDNLSGSFLSIKDNDYIKTTISIRRKEKYINCLLESYERKKDAYPKVTIENRVIWDKEAFKMEMQQIFPSLPEKIFTNIDTLYNVSEKIFKKREYPVKSSSLDKDREETSKIVENEVIS